MAGEDIHHEKLLWDRGSPIWPREPDVGVISSLAKHHLVAEFPAPFDDALLEISFFAEGGFNKLWQISYTGHHTSYLLRVAVPVEPFYKTESEVATIAYLRANTSIPVPKILAWDSNRDNELTFEWILMEKIDGVSLMDVWRKVPWERKLELTEFIAGMFKQLRDQKFERIGGLYFTSALNHASTESEKTPESEKLVKSLAVTESANDQIEKSLEEPVDEPVEESWIEGLWGSHWVQGWRPLHVTSRFLRFLEGLSLEARGTAPSGGDVQCIVDNGTNDLQQRLSCNSTDESVQEIAQEADAIEKRAIVSLQRSELQKPTSGVDQAEFSVGRMFDSLFFVGSRPRLSANRGPYQSSLEWLSALVRVQLEWIKNGPMEEDEEDKDDFEGDVPKIERLCKGFLDVLPTLCGNEENPASFCLHHSDLNSANILVHPETFEIMGIVDWELINVVPEWRAFEHPHFLVNIEPFTEEEPPIPIYEDNEDDAAVYRRDYWDDRILRRHFDQTMKRLNGDNAVCVENTVEAKRMCDCRENIPALTGMWNWARMWLKAYKTTGVSKSSEDWSKEVRVYGEEESDEEDFSWLDGTDS